MLRPRAAQEVTIDRGSLGPGVAVVGLWAALGLALVVVSGPAGIEEQFPELPPGAFERIEGKGSHEEPPYRSGKPSKSTLVPPRLP